MQEFLWEEYQFLILLTLLIAVQTCFVLKRRNCQKKIRYQIQLIKQILQTTDPNHTVTENIHFFHHELQKQSSISDLIKQSWENFYLSFQRKQQTDHSLIPSMEDHLDEVEFSQVLGKRKGFELLPGIFLTIGILFPLLELYLSIYDFVTKNSGSITQVLQFMSGIGVAFLGSIIAIGLSLFWQVSNRHTYDPFLLQQFDDLLDAFQQAFPSDDPTSVLQKIVETQKSQMEDLKTFMSETLIPNFAAQIGFTLAPHLETNQSIMKEALKKITQNHVMGMEKMVHQLIESLNKMKEDQMQELGNTLRQAVKWQEKMHGDMSELVQSLQYSAIKQTEMAEKTTTLTTEIQHYTSRLLVYQSALQSMISELNDTTNKNKELQIVTADLLDKITAERHAYQSYAEAASIQLRENAKQMAHHTDIQNQLHKDYQGLTAGWYQTVDVVQKLTSTNIDLLDKVSSQTEQFSKISTQLKEVLSAVTETSHTHIKAFTDVQEMQHQLHTEREQIQHQLSEQLQQMDQRSAQLKEYWTSTHHMIKELNEQLNESSNRFVQHMNRGLEQTFIQFDTALTNSVNALASGVGTLESLFQELPTQVEQLNHHVGEINQTLSKSISEANQSITQAIREVQHQTEVLSQNLAVRR